MATNLQEIEKQIQNLSPEQLEQFRTWYEDFDAKNWDEKIQSDSDTGKLDGLANEALEEHRQLCTKRL